LLGSDQILAELIQTGGETLWSVIHELNSVWNKEELPDHITIYIRGDKTDMEYDCYQLHKKCYQIPFSQS
jgi:hypothetical protein